MGHRSPDNGKGPLSAKLVLRDLWHVYGALCKTRLRGTDSGMLDTRWVTTG